MTNLKSLTFVLFFTALAGAPLAEAGPNRYPCERLSAQAIRADFSEYYGEASNPDLLLIETIQCRRISTLKRDFYTCDVTASRGQGSSAVHMGVLLDASCSRVTQTYLRSE